VFCRGGHCPSAEKDPFSDFPKENNSNFALRRWILQSKIHGRAMLAPTFKIENMHRKKPAAK
jgi:hypothetical protein